MNLTQKRYRQAKDLIPGGVQLLSKKPEMYDAAHWPAYHSKAKGCEVWDLDGNHYYDFTSNGIGACLLGFAYDPVVEAVTKKIQSGSMRRNRTHTAFPLQDIIFSNGSLSRAYTSNPFLPTRKARRSYRIRFARHA